MRQYFLKKWIQELNQEIEKAKREQNHLKHIELKWFQNDLTKLLDKINR